MQPRTSILPLALAALVIAAPATAAESEPPEPEYDGTYIVLAYENGTVVAFWHLDGFSFDNTHDSNFILNPTHGSIRMDVYGPAMWPALRMWDTSSMVVFSTGDCEAIKPGLDPDGDPPVFVIIQEECLIGPSFGANYDGPCGVVNPGVDPNRFPYVFVAFQPECLEPVFPGLSSNSMAVWHSGPSTGVYSDGPCGIVNPGVDPNHFPYVFITFRPECLEPYFSGFPLGMEAEWRW